MSSLPTIDFTPLIGAVVGLFNGVIASVASALPMVGGVLGVVAVLALMFAVGERIPIVGQFVARVREWVSGLGGAL